MSIQTEIDRIKANIAEAYIAVNEKGGVLPDVLTSDSLAEAIRGIPSGGAGISLSIATPPSRTSYYVGDSFDATGLVVRGTFDDSGLSFEIPVSYLSISPSGALSEDVTSVTISFEGQSVQQPITVTEYVVTIPSQAGTLTYNGSAQTPQWEDFDSANSTVQVTPAIDAGNYSAVFTLTRGVWSDGTKNPKTIPWSIAKAAGSLSLNKTSLSLDASTLTGTISVTRPGDGAITASSSDASIAEVSVSGTTITVTAKKEGSATITVSVAGGTNYTAPQSRTCSVSVTFNKIFGVMWDYANESTALTRLTPVSDPKKYVNTTVSGSPSPAVGTGAGSSPFDNYAPWRDMEEYNIINGAVSYKRGSSGFSRTAYDTMVYIPEFYYAVVDDATNSKRYFYISDSPAAGFEKHPGSGRYVGRYHTISGYYSKSGAAPLVSITRATARTGSTAKGSKWCQYDFATWNAVWMLYLVEYADWDSQSKIGRGYVDGNSAALNSGATDSMIYHTGRAAGEDGKTAVQYRHIENPWGNVYQWVDGANFNARAAYICLDPDKYADDTTDNYTATGVTLPSSGWIKSLGFSDAFPWAFLPNANGGSETTDIPDRVHSNTGWRVLCVGGYWLNGSAAGLFFFYAGDSASSASSGVGARLLYIP